MALGGVLFGALLTNFVNDQISRRQTQTAEKAAAAAKESAAAAQISANAAATNAQNAGIHAVARLRQEWINTLRAELSELHTLLANFRSPVPEAEEAGAQAAREERQRLANARAAKIKLLINPTERASQNLLQAMRQLERPDLTPKARAWKARWVIVWGEIILKEEWDRVRAELGAAAAVQPLATRPRRKKPFSLAAMAAARPWRETTVLPAPRPRSRTKKL